MTERERAIDRAKKLNMMAQDQPDSPEGKTASALLARLRGKWSLKDEEIVTHDVKRLDVQNPWTAEADRWTTLLLACCAEFFGCSSTHARSHSVIYGNTDDARNAHELWQHLCGVLDRGFTREQALPAKPDLFYPFDYLGFTDVEPPPIDRYAWGMSGTMMLQNRMVRISAQKLAKEPNETGLVRQGQEAAADEAKKNAPAGPANYPPWEFVPAVRAYVAGVRLTVPREELTGSTAPEVTAKEPPAPPPDPPVDAPTPNPD